MSLEAEPAPFEVYCLNVTLFVEEERREEFLRCIQANQNGTLAPEDLCLQYTWGEDETCRNTFHFQVQYIGSEGLEAKWEKFAEWEKFAKSDLFTAPPNLMLFKSVTTGRKA